MKKKNIIPLLLTAAAIVFEILPYGAKLTFAVASLSFAFMNLTVTAALISLMLASAWLGAQLIYKA